MRSLNLFKGFKLLVRWYAICKVIFDDYESQKYYVKHFKEYVIILLSMTSSNPI